MFDVAVVSMNVIVVSVADTRRVCCRCASSKDTARKMIASIVAVMKGMVNIGLYVSIVCPRIPAAMVSVTPAPAMSPRLMFLAVMICVSLLTSA